MAASNASNEQRLALREDLKRQLADMRAMQDAAEKTKAEQQELLARIAAMESKVSHVASWRASHITRLCRPVRPHMLVAQCTQQRSMAVAQQLHRQLQLPHNLLCLHAPSSRHV